MGLFKPNLTEGDSLAVVLFLCCARARRGDRRLSGPPPAPFANRTIVWPGGHQSPWALPKWKNVSYLPLYHLKPNTTLVARLSAVDPVGERTRAAS